MSLILAEDRPETTRLVTRGARRFLRACGFSVVAELPLPNGRRADLVALSSDGALRIVEVKSGVNDFRADTKWPEYRNYCDCFYFAAPLDLDQAIFPSDAGLIVADAHEGALLREAPLQRLASSSRRAMLLRFATHAADRYCALAYREDRLL